MSYTEIKQKNNRKYYYRVKSVKKGKQVRKERIYLGANLSKKTLVRKIKKADKELKPLNLLITAVSNLKLMKQTKSSF